MDHERAALFVHTHQDGTTVSAFAFDRRIGVSSAGGAVGTVSTSGAGTTLSVLCGRAGIAATNSKFGNQRKFVPDAHVNNRCR